MWGIGIEVVGDMGKWWALTSHLYFLRWRFDSFGSFAPHPSSSVSRESQWITKSKPFEPRNWTISIMSFGRPPTFAPFSPTPPDRGSFPLDHEGKTLNLDGYKIVT
jgi:hypothetical protein